MLAPLLLATSAALLSVFGLLHLRLIGFGDRLAPRDAAVEAGMRETALRLTRETTVWRAWTGFNASHGLGLLLFGVLYGYLALYRFGVLQQAPFLLAAGTVYLAGMLVLARRYFFSVPFFGVSASLVLYVAGALLALR